MDSLTFATWTLVAVTLAYVILTGFLMLQNHRLVARQTMPEVVVFIEASKQCAAYLVVQNAGAGIATNIKVKGAREMEVAPADR